MFLGMKMFGIVIFRYERKFEVQGLVKPGFALFEMSGVKLIMEQGHTSPTATNIHLGRGKITYCYHLAASS